MINRRMILAAAAGLAFSASTASAQDWKAKYPELVFAKVPDENASGTSDRWTPLTEYLSRELGTKVTLRIANDYAAVVGDGRGAWIPHIIEVAFKDLQPSRNGLAAEPGVVFRGGLPQRDEIVAPARRSRLYLYAAAHEERLHVQLDRPVTVDRRI